MFTCPVVRQGLPLLYSWVLRESGELLHIHPVDTARTWIGKQHHNEKQSWWCETRLDSTQPAQLQMLASLGVLDTATILKSATAWQNQQNDLCAQKRLRSAWVPAKSDQSSLSAWRNIGPLTIHWAHSKDSDQTGRMPRLIWVFAGHTHHFIYFVVRQLKYYLRSEQQRQWLGWADVMAWSPWK